MFGRRKTPLVSVVVPAYDVAAYLPACLDSLLAQSLTELEVVVVDDGSPDACGAIAEEYAGSDPRVRVLHIPNGGLGAARNEGARHAHGRYLGFCDADDLMTPRALELMVAAARELDAPLVTGNVVRWEADRPVRMPWMDRLHADRGAVSIDEVPELLGDVFAWNKLFRRDWWDASGLTWPERLRYEDQPATTDAYLRAGRIAIVPEVVYRWRVRDDGTSITQQRGTITDLTDRWITKRMAIASVEAHGVAAVTDAFRERVLPGDMWQYFMNIPDCSDEWWELLVTGVRDLWGPEHSLTGVSLPPMHRLVGWLVEQDRREDAAHVITYARRLGAPLPRVPLEGGGVRVDVPGLNPATVAPEALRLRDHES
ncbi:glycosyltransferase family 2 protein [Nocardioides humilatus]|uniref:glycosyltransferase family 2 protein n=1 Tax=Nocardioides humilatus TaxID=2607660 RepID=UPI001FEC5952|nr:glycosyltransferase family 2 protein [Nocardioides humilatus]